MKKVYIAPKIQTEQINGEELLDSVSVEVVEDSEKVIESSEEIEANTFSVWDEE